jgi:sirohydrochlorin ferrochelatase
MTAPALVLLGHGSHNPRVTQVSRQIRAGLLELRPELDVKVAFLDHGAPSVLQVTQKLVGHGVTEVVFVPLMLSDAFLPSVEVTAALADVKTAHPQLRVAAARPLGPEASLLSILDGRLRDALRARHVSELDGLVFAAAGSSDVRSNALVSRRARQWSTHHRLPCVTAFASGSAPGAAEAVRSLRGQGRRHIAVGSWFLAPGLLYSHQSELAFEAGAVAVSEPLGGESEIAEVALARYVVAAMELVDIDDIAEVEPMPVRHLSVVGSGFDSSDALTEERAG